MRIEDYKRCEKLFIFTKTKGKQPRSVPISAALVDAIDRWLTIRPDVESQLLFISNTGGYLDVASYGKVFARYVKFAGIDKFTLHGIRHYSLTELAKQDLWAAVAIAGLKDAKTTMIYARHDPDHIREAHRAAAPLEKIVVNKAQVKRKRVV